MAFLSCAGFAAAALFSGLVLFMGQGLKVNRYIKFDIIYNGIIVERLNIITAVDWLLDCHFPTSCFAIYRTLNVSFYVVIVISIWVFV